MLTQGRLLLFTVSPNPKSQTLHQQKVCPVFALDSAESVWTSRLDSKESSLAVGRGNQFGFVESLKS